MGTKLRTLHNSFLPSALENAPNPTRRSDYVWTNADAYMSIAISCRMLLWCDDRECSKDHQAGLGCTTFLVKDKRLIIDFILTLRIPTLATFRSSALV